MKKLSRHEIEDTVEDSMSYELTPDQQKVVDTPLPAPDSRWGNDAWSRRQWLRKLPAPMTAEQLAALNEAGRK
jgi:hypothetical protein